MKQPKTELQVLQDIARQRGYAPGWATKVLAGREKKRREEAARRLKGGAR